MAKQSDAAEVARRVEAVLRIRLDGAQHHDIVAYAEEQKWGVSDRQVRTYIRRADALLVERRDTSRRRLVARHIAQRESLFARAVNGADYRTALAVADSLSKLQGLFTDSRDLKEGARLVELETRLEDARRHPAGAPAAGPADGSPPGADPGAGGTAGPLPGGPGAPDDGRGPPAG